MSITSAAGEPAKSAAARIAEHIVAQIDSGAYSVGAKLPAETRLADEFGVSRPSVREALKALQFVGYVESVRGSGTRVVNTSRSRQTPSTPATVTSLEILQLFEARLVVEPSVAAAAARDPDLHKLRQAEDLIEGMGLVVSEGTLHAETDLLVHRAMAEICRNRFLRQSLTDLLNVTASDHLASIRKHAWADSELPEVWGEHLWQIVRAIRDRDAATAAELSWQHVASSARNALAVVRTDPALEPSAVRQFVAVLEGGPYAVAGRRRRAESAAVVVEDQHSGHRTGR